MASESFTRSSSEASSRAIATGSRSGGGSAKAALSVRGSVCAFWIGRHCFGLDTALVGEIVSIEDRIPVPLAPPAVRGIFSLRGEPLPLVSLAEILEIREDAPNQKAITAMVLRSADLAAGLSIDRVQAILPVDPGKLTPPTNAVEDSMILGFLELTTEKTAPVVSVLDPAALLERLSRLRYLREQTT